MRVLLLGLWVLSGCVDEGEAAFAELPCDTLEADCQRAVYRATAEVAQMRAGGQPPVREISVQQLARELRERAEAEDEEADPRLEQGWSRGLALLGLLPEDQSLRDAALAHDVANVAAFYDAELKMVSLVDRESDGPEQDLFVLAHELAHALRDTESDLLAFREEHADSIDAHAATTALIEGEAMVIAAAVVARAVQGTAAYSIDWDRLSDGIEEAAFDTIDAAPAPLIAAVQQLPYAFGTRELAWPWDEEGRAVVDALYDDPVLSLIDWSDSPRRRTAPLVCSPTAPPPGYVGEDSDVLGVAGLLTLHIELDGARAALDASHAWRDDRIVLFRPADDADSAERAIAWRIGFDNAASAHEFAQRSSFRMPAGARLSQHGDELLLIAASFPGVLDAWTEAASCGRAEDVPVSQDD